MLEEYSYAELYQRLNFETATVLFIKRDGTIRSMLCTRSIDTIKLDPSSNDLRIALDWQEKRCNIKNNNISVIDLEIWETRAFNVGRVIAVGWYGDVKTKEQFEKVMNDHKEFSERYNAKIKRILEDIDDMDLI